MRSEPLRSLCPPRGRWKGYYDGDGSFDARRKVVIMSGSDKIKNAAEEAAGKGKEAVGDATDNEKLQAEGKADQTKANLKQAGEKVKDAFKG